MGPKIQAIVWYLEAGGKQALITNPQNIGRALRVKRDLDLEVGRGARHAASGRPRGRGGRE